MDAQELRAAMLRHFERDGFTETQDENVKLPLLLQRGDERWGFALCEDQPEVMAYLGAFEADMQAVIDAAQLQRPGLHLGMAVGFASTANGEESSYRRALKKYSNSIVFEDLGLTLFLVRGSHEVLTLAPKDVNVFLRDLNRFIADQRL